MFERAVNPPLFPSWLLYHLKINPQVSKLCLIALKNCWEGVLDAFITLVGFFKRDLKVQT